MKKKKWYASYSGVGEFMLINEEQKQNFIQELLEEEDHERIKDVDFMQEFPTFAAAKKYVMGGIRCDIGDLKTALIELRRMKAK